MADKNIYDKIKNYFNDTDKKAVYDLLKQNIVFKYSDENISEVIIDFPKDKEFQPTEHQFYYLMYLLDKINAL